MTEMMSTEPIGFWDDAHKYAFTTGEEQFVSEIAYIMTTLHEEGYDNKSLETFRANSKVSSTS